MDFDTGCWLKCQIYSFRYPRLSKFFVLWLCKAPFTGAGEMLAHQTCFRHPIWPKCKPRGTVLAACMADLYFWSGESHPQCVPVSHLVCNKVLCMAARAVCICAWLSTGSSRRAPNCGIEGGWAAPLPHEPASTYSATAGLSTPRSAGAIWRNRSDSWANSQ